MTGKKILVVEDEEIVALDLQICLQFMGYEVSLASSGEEAVEIARRLQPDVVLMDIKLDSIDGVEAAQRIRRHSDVPVVFLTAYADPATVARAADVMPDGYIVKPFKELDLAAAVYLAIHRTTHRAKVCWCKQGSTEKGAQPVTQLGRLRIDHSGHHIRCGNRAVHLTNKEFRILEMLAKSVGSPCSPESILSEVWGPEFVHYIQALRVHIKNLRKKLGSDSGVVLEAVHGVGYRLVEVEEQMAQPAG